MKRTQLISIISLSLVASFTGWTSLPAGEWMTYRSTYTHDAYGQRVDQHTKPVEPLSPDQGNLVRSGYRHYRSTIQGSTTADNLHVTHEWGRPVMPYEHWRFPFRPYGVPYDQWGPPVPNVLSNFNVQGGGFYPGQNMPGNMMPGNMMPGNLNPGNMMPGNMMPGNMMPGNVYQGYPNPMPSPNAPWINGLYPSN